MVISGEVVTEVIHHSRIKPSTRAQKHLRGIGVAKLMWDAMSDGKAERMAGLDVKIIRK